MITLYGISNCDSIRKTRKILEQENKTYTFHDYRKDGIDEDLARLLLAQFPPEQIINRRGTTWRQLPEALRRELNEATALQLMVESPAVIKRPLLNKNDQWLLGFDEESLKAL